MQIINSEQLRKLFFDYWKNLEFDLITPTSVISPSTWPYSLLVGSGFVNYADSILSTKKLGKKQCTIQPSIKLGTGIYSFEDLMVHNDYLCFFEQLSCGVFADNLSAEQFILLVWKFLVDEIGINEKSLVIGLPKNRSKLKEVLVNNGIQKDSIFESYVNAFHFNLGDFIKGNYVSFFLDRAKSLQHLCSKENCNINCDCERYLELGDIGIVEINGISLLDHGMSLERLLVTINNLSGIPFLSQFREARKILSSTFDLSENNQQLIADICKSTLALLASGIVPGNKGVYFCLRKLIRKIFWIISKTSTKNPVFFSKDSIEKLWNALELDIYFKNVELGHITDCLNKEFEVTQGLIKKGKKEIQKILRDNDSLSEEDYFFLYDTHGVPVNIAKQLFKNIKTT